MSDETPKPSVGTPAGYRVVDEDLGVVEIEFDPDEQVSKLVETAEAELKAATAHFKREQADREREAKEHAEAEERLERAKAFYAQVMAMISEKASEIDSIKLHYRSQADAGASIPAGFFRRRAGVMSLVTVPLLLVGMWFLRPALTVNNSATASATVITAEELGTIIVDDEAYPYLPPASQEAIREALGYDPMDEQGG